MDKQEMIDEIVRDTIREIGIDPSDRLSSLSYEQVRKEYLFLNSLIGWD